jgi:hypothetical protein
MGDPARGAQLGRPTTDPADVAAAASPFRFYLQRVRLDAGGYDSGGAYWGVGAPLYRFEAGEGADDLTEWPAGFLRARTRADAKRQLRDTYAGARFYA